jgi:hypothetical protein
VIYLDSSVVLAEVFGEDVHPSDGFWSEGEFVSSRLLQYEVWNRVHGRRAGETHGDDVRTILSGLAFAELSDLVLARAMEPFPVAVRTLDALHLASIEFLRNEGQPLSLASYDRRLSHAAEAIGIPLEELAES